MRGREFVRAHQRYCSTAPSNPPVYLTLFFKTLLSFGKYSDPVVTSFFTRLLRPRVIYNVAYLATGQVLPDVIKIVFCLLISSMVHLFPLPFLFSTKLEISLVAARPIEENLIRDRIFVW